jgi:hypothetical protein
MRPYIEGCAARVVLAIAVIATASGCGSRTPTAPTPPAYDLNEVAIFLVGDEAFRFRLSTPALSKEAHEMLATGRKRIPIGRIVQGTDVNARWTWHLEDVSFADLTIELCDGRPSDVERDGPRFGNGMFCPWGATIVGILPGGAR